VATTNNRVHNIGKRITQNFITMSHILICHTDSIIVQGLEAFLTSIEPHQIYTTKTYLDCLNSAHFLQELGETFVVIAEGNILDSAKCSQLAKFERAKLILCDRSANYNSLLIALNCNSSYISLEHNDPQNLALAVQCAFVGSVFICPQVKKKLSQCVFQSKLEQRQAVARLAEVDQRILALVSQGHTHHTIGKIVNYSTLNVGYRLKVIVQTLNLQTKQEAIALANSIGLNLSLSDQTFQVA
jgi:DNA-binding NarL/FixJ family response regulator